MRKTFGSSQASGSDFARRRSAAVRVGIGVTLAVGVFGLTGCAPEPGESTAPETTAPTTSVPATTTPPKPSPSPTKTPAPKDPFAAPITIPGCAELISAETAQSLSGQPSYTVFDDDVTANLAQQAQDFVLGPAAVNAIGQADPLTRCSWGIPSSSASVTLFIGVLPDAARTEFRAELDAAGFQAAPVGDADGYALQTDGGIASVYQWHGFVGDLWLTEVGVAGGGEFSATAIEAIRAANAA